MRGIISAWTVASSEKKQILPLLFIALRIRGRMTAFVISGR